MNPNPEARFHLAFAALWGGVVIALCLAIVLASGEQQALARRRGADFKQRSDLLAQQERLKGEIEWLASRPSLEQAVMRLGLPISPPSRFASR
jgi:hypothetical protein